MLWLAWFTATIRSFVFKYAVEQTRVGRNSLTMSSEDDLFELRDVYLNMTLLQAFGNGE
jgi:hypothetical protein